MQKNLLFREISMDENACEMQILCYNDYVPCHESLIHDETVILYIS